MEPAERLLTVAQVAQGLLVSEETVRRWLREGTLEGFRAGGTRAGWRVRASDLAAFVDRRARWTQNQRESRAPFLARRARWREHEQAQGQEPGRASRIKSRSHKPLEVRNTRHERQRDDAAHPETGDVPEQAQGQEETA